MVCQKYYAALLISLIPIGTTLITSWIIPVYVFAVVILTAVYAPTLKWFLFGKWIPLVAALTILPCFSLYIFMIASYYFYPFRLPLEFSEEFAAFMSVLLSTFQMIFVLLPALIIYGLKENN